MKRFEKVKQIKIKSRKDAEKNTCVSGNENNLNCFFGLTSCCPEMERM